jgi:hypothetical protein
VGRIPEAGKMKLLPVFIGLFLVPALLPASSDSTCTPFLITVAYANDDFFAENQVNSFVRSDIFPANDDFVTTSLFLNFSSHLFRRPFSSSLFYYIITDRWMTYRSDIMVFHADTEIQSGGLAWNLGTGFSISGDLGGTSLQNGYHRVFGYKNVSLPYRTGYAFGGLASVTVSKPLYKSNSNVITSHFRLQPVIGRAMPGHAEIGGNWQATAGAFRWETTIAYRHRFSLMPEYRRIFGSSFYSGARAAYAVTSSILAAVWMTKNQYGVQNDLQFGLTIMYRMGDEPVSSMKELMVL